MWVGLVGSGKVVIGLGSGRGILHDLDDLRAFFFAQNESSLNVDAQAKSKFFCGVGFELDESLLDILDLLI